MGFSTIGLYLFYFAYRYNLLFVNVGAVDTKGLIYPKALQHTLVGCYLGVICMIGLFGIRAAAGPLVLMIIYLIFMILYHIAVYSAIKPLLYYLPRTLEAEEEDLMGAEHGVVSTSSNGRSEKNAIADGSEASNAALQDLGPAPHDKPSMLKKFLRPDIYTDYATMRRLVPRGIDIAYSPDVEQDAYHHPAVQGEPPLLWVPRDPMGVSRQECAHTSRVTPMTDEGAGFDDKGKIVWYMEETEGRPPIYSEKVYY